MSSDNILCFSEKLPAEAEEGNIEYKLQLINPSKNRLEHLITQLNWRLTEGQGEAIYEIGVEDSGLLCGLDEEDMHASLNTLKKMADGLNAEISILHKREIDGFDNDTRTVAEVLIRRVPDSHQFIDLRIAVLGNVDAGKSTLLGVLTQGERDNGRGRARLNLFRHVHEVESGRTSSISHEIIGFDCDGQLLNYSNMATAAEICSQSSKVIMMIDMCGDQKYIKTTIKGLTGHHPDYALLVVSAITGVAGTTREHLGLALALNIPAFLVVSKIDSASPHQLKSTIRQLETLVKGTGCRKKFFQVRTKADSITAASTFHNDNICPIFLVSSVSGQNLHMLTMFLNNLAPCNSHSQREMYLKAPFEMQIEVFFSMKNIGTVVGGPVLRGNVRTGDNILVGPNDDGEFVDAVVHSIHRNRETVHVAHAGQHVGFSLGYVDQLSIRAGMVLLSSQETPCVCYEFEADVYILYHSHNLCTGFQTVIHIGNIRQTAKIVSISKPSLKTNEKGLVKFCFINRPEYIKIGSQLIFREGRTKGMGQVTQIFPPTSVNS